VQSKKSKQKPSPKHYSIDFEAIGTHWSIEVFEVVSKPDDLTLSINERIEEFDKNYSRFRADSLVTQISLVSGTYTLPGDAEPMFDLYFELYKLTGGRMTPLIGRTISDAGYDADYSLRPKVLEPTPLWDDCLEYNFPNLNVLKPTLLDLGACGKGYLVDIMGGVIRSHGVENFCINAGGDMLVYGTSVDVALENPDNTAEAVGVATLQDNALCGSAGNRRSWASYTHILDPASLTSPTHIKALWVSAKTTMLADALTTGLYFALPQDLYKHYTFDYAIIGSNNSLTYSPNFPGNFFGAS